jgi:uncharacterized protein (DUF1330 family)
LVLGAGGATLYTHAATGPAFYAVYEANVTDEDAYKKALPDAQKIIKDAGGVYIAGGFNKAKVDHGSPAVGNRYVLIRYENEAAYDKFYTRRHCAASEVVAWPSRRTASQHAAMLTGAC